MTVAPSAVSIIGGVEATSLCLDVSSDVLDELANRDVRMESDPVALRQGRQSPRVAFHCSLTYLPTYSPSMGILWSRLEARLN